MAVIEDSCNLRCSFVDTGGGVGGLVGVIDGTTFVESGAPDTFIGVLTGMDTLEF